MKDFMNDLFLVIIGIIITGIISAVIQGVATIFTCHSQFWDLQNYTTTEMIWQIIYWIATFILGLYLSLGALEDEKSDEEPRKSGLPIYNRC